MLPGILIGSGLVCAQWSDTTLAADIDWSSCPPPPGVFGAPPPAAPDKPGQTELSANEVVSQLNGISRFRGDVVVQRDTRIFRGDEGSYDDRSQEVTLTGNVVFQADALITQSDSARMNMENEQGEFSNVRFHFPEQHAFGSAEQLIVTDPKHSSLSGVRYTTCNPQQEDWVLSASEITLNEESNTGEAWQTVFRVKGVPIFYSPYLNFPLSGRKSGLLAPHIGHSNTNGNLYTQPVYWNIAPNYDATITPRYMSERGLMGMGEFRFLTESTQGDIKADHLSDDKIYGDDRSYLAINHRAKLAPGWSSNLIYRGASDSDYLDELALDENVRNASHLERSLKVNYSDTHWNFMARAQSYQALTGAEPYQRLPQITLQGHSTPRPNQLQYLLDSEVVTFAHDSRTPVGTRLDLKPAISYPLQGAAWYLTPTAAVRHTEYRLDDYSAGEELTRSLPIFSLDSGLFFERETSINDQTMTHTLEPRLFYLHVPYEDQDDLPRFDTGISRPSFSQLFLDNRFTGADRQGDANQITAALTTRLLNDADGHELLRASIGRSYYLADRRVTLRPSDADETVEYSDIFAELEMEPIPRLRLGLDLRYDTELDEERQLGGRVHYQPEQKKLVSLDYRFDKERELEQSDAVLYWQLMTKWQLLGHWRYDHENADDLEQMLGLEYESCCWAIRLVGRNRRDTVTEDFERDVLLTFSFKGLGSLGESLEETLPDGALDYD